jgi:heptosyltransferase-2
VLRILCVRFSSIGDVLLTTPLVRALRRRHPDAELYFVTKRAMAPLVAENPHITRVLTLEPGEPITALARRLRALHPSHGLDLHGSLRSTALRLLVRCRWSGYSKRKLARTALIATKLDLYGKHVPVPERYFEAARALDARPDGGPPEFFLSAAAQQRVTRWLAEHGLDRQPLAALAALGPAVVSAAGEFTLQETGACLARAAVLVSGDTGVMHMATGVGTPVVALFGPTVEAFGFFPYTERAVVLEQNLPCRPCSAMGTERCPLGHHRCLEDVLPDQVAAAVAQLVA